MVGRGQPRRSRGEGLGVPPRRLASCGRFPQLILTKKGAYLYSYRYITPLFNIYALFVCSSFIISLLEAASLLSLTPHISHFSHFSHLLLHLLLPPYYFCHFHHITSVDNASTNAQETSAGSNSSKLCQESQCSCFRYGYELSVGIGYGAEGEEGIKLPELQQPTSGRQMC